MGYRGFDLKLRKPEPASEMELMALPLLRIKPPQVQVALDMDASISTICDIAVKSYAGGARVIEAGTPAIKRHGTDRLIKALRRRISSYCRRNAIPNEAVIMADMKTMDVGNLEARIAYRSGADIVNVLGIGSVHKIREALSEAIRGDRAICVDLMQCPDPLAKVEEFAGEFKEFREWIMLCMHKGISEQLKGRGIHEERSLLEEARRRSEGFMLAVAGGIYPGTAKEVAAAGADICVVGSAIYNSSDPEDVTRMILEEIRENDSRGRF